MIRRPPRFTRPYSLLPSTTVFRSAVMAEEPIERMDGFSCRAGDHRLVQRRVAVGDGGVDLDHWVATIMGVDRSAGFARPAQVEGLAIRGSPVSLPRPGGDRLGVD